MANVSLNTAKFLFNKYCKYKAKYVDDVYCSSWNECEACCLRHIPYQILHGFTGIINRDLCFAIWHEDLFNNNLKIQTEKMGGKTKNINNRFEILDIR
jgi:hypothetical protein